MIKTHLIIWHPVIAFSALMLIIALEVKSVLGLVTYKNFSHLLKEGEAYPVLRVVKNGD